jgi:hypothetical protein
LPESLVLLSSERPHDNSEFVESRVKPEGEGITEIRVHEARAEHKPNFSNALTQGLMQHEN